jgi:hypothetical protein
VNADPLAEQWDRQGGDEDRGDEVDRGGLGDLEMAEAEHEEHRRDDDGEPAQDLQSRPRRREGGPSMRGERHRDDEAAEDEIAQPCHLHRGHRLGHRLRGDVAGAEEDSGRDDEADPGEDLVGTGGGEHGCAIDERRVVGGCGYRRWRRHEA